MSFHANYWQEREDKIVREAKADAAAIFKIKKTDKGISLQTASGKFVATTALDPLSVVSEAENAVVFEVVENPTVKEVPAKPAAESTPAESPKPTKE